MRLSAIMGAAALGLSAAVVAQVATTPVEEKVPTGDERAPAAEALSNDSAAEPAVDADNAIDNTVGDEPATVANTVEGDPQEASAKPRPR